MTLRQMFPFRSQAFALVFLSALVAPPSRAGAQTRSEREAFTWAGRIPQGRWITVRNMNGPIEVVPASGDQVEVVAARHTRRGDPEIVRFEVQKYGPNGEDVLICALWGDRSECDEDGYRSRGDGRRSRDEVWVDFTVRVPRGVRVGVHTVNGEVEVTDVAGEVDASTVNGSVDVSTRGGPVNARSVNGSVRATMGRFEMDTDLTFATVNGSVVAIFEGDVNARVDLSTVNGRFLTDFPVTITGRIDPKRLRATLGRGGPRIQLTTVNGNVELRKR